MPDLSHEMLWGRAEGKVLCGVDEVGRGPLAGPVMAAAAIVPLEGLPPEIAVQIKDSKKLSEKQREALYPVLIDLCPYAVAEASVEEIDQINILQASLLAMRRAVEALPQKAEHALIDGNKAPKLLIPCTTIVKGDDKSLSIAIAAIIAKVTRDRFMKKLNEKFPGYGWEHNAGYPTAAHLEALERLGATDWHRNFGPVVAVRAAKQAA